MAKSPEEKNAAVIEKAVKGEQKRFVAILKAEAANAVEATENKGEKKLIKGFLKVVLSAVKPAAVESAAVKPAAVESAE